MPHKQPVFHVRMPNIFPSSQMGVVFLFVCFFIIIVVMYFLHLTILFFACHVLLSVFTVSSDLLFRFFFLFSLKCFVMSFLNAV